MKNRITEIIDSGKPTFTWTPPPEMRHLNKYELHAEFVKARKRWERGQIRANIDMDNIGPILPTAEERADAPPTDDQD